MMLAAIGTAFLCSRRVGAGPLSMYAVARELSILAPDMVRIHGMNKGRSLIAELFLE
jgi:hypothetical protein